MQAYSSIWRPGDHLALNGKYSVISNGAASAAAAAAASASHHVGAAAAYCNLHSIAAAGNGKTPVEFSNQTF